VLANVMLPLVVTGAAAEHAEKRARAALDKVGLLSKAASMPLSLSGGEQQRVAIARALARSPRVVLADEPTGNLDTRNGEMVMELLARMHSELQITLVLVTHDEWIAERADRVLRLADGRLVEDSAVPVAEEVAR
jgi:cell division transport system ATP-binding protein